MYCEKYKKFSNFILCDLKQSTIIYILMLLKKSTVFEKNNSTYKKSQTSNINQN